MAFKKIVVAGGGVLGSQIALQTAYWGYDVTIWLRLRVPSVAASPNSTSSSSSTSRPSRA